MYVCVYMFVCIGCTNLTERSFVHIPSFSVKLACSRTVDACEINETFCSCSFVKKLNLFVNANEHVLFKMNNKEAILLSQNIELSAWDNNCKHNYSLIGDLI